MLQRIARFFMNKIGLNFYKRKPEEWKQIQTNEFKKRKMLDDLLETNNETASNSGNKNLNKKKKV